MDRALRCGWAALIVVTIGCHHGAPAAGDDDLPPGAVDAGGDDDVIDAAPPSGTPVTYDVHLRTEVGGQYLSATNAGGGAVDATAPIPREWELFHLIDADGGTLSSGDLVYLRPYDQASYLRAHGGALDATGTAADAEAAFELVRVAGDGAVFDGDHVALRARATQAYVSAKNGGGGAVDASAATAAAWEHFVIDGPPRNPDQPKTKRVVGYLPNWYGSFADQAQHLDFAKVTQVNLAFALGDDAGNLQLAPGDQIDAFVTAAHARGVKVFPSLCGGGGDGRIAPHYQPDQVDGFVDKIIAFVAAHHMDGIDVDVEAPQRMGAAYDAFIAKLRAKAGPHGWQVTAAVAEWMQNGMSDQTLRSFDFITVMSYDNAGTWTGPGAHSSLQQAKDSIAFYKARGVAPDRIVLGVPFYGYCWGNCGGKSSAYVLYKDVLARFPDAWKQDWIDADGAQLSYNGTATMAAKTQLGRSYGGVMIWELGGDVGTSDTHSLLRAIDTAP